MHAGGTAGRPAAALPARHFAFAAVLYASFYGMQNCSFTYLAWPCLRHCNFKHCGGRASGGTDPPVKPLVTLGTVFPSHLCEAGNFPHLLHATQSLLLGALRPPQCSLNRGALLVPAAPQRRRCRPAAARPPLLPQTVAGSTAAYHLLQSAQTDIHRPERALCSAEMAEQELSELGQLCRRKARATRAQMTSLRQSGGTPSQRRVFGTRESVWASAWQSTRAFVAAMGSLVPRSEVLAFASVPSAPWLQQIETAAAIRAILQELLQVSSYDGGRSKCCCHGCAMALPATRRCRAAARRPPPGPPLRAAAAHRRPSPRWCGAGFVTPQAISAALDITAVQTKVGWAAGGAAPEGKPLAFGDDACLDGTPGPNATKQSCKLALRHCHTCAGAGGPAGCGGGARRPGAACRR